MIWKRIQESKLNHLNIASELRMTQFSTAQLASTLINKSLSLSFTIQLHKPSLSSLEFNFHIQIIKLKFGVRSAKSSTPKKLILFRKITDSIMEQHLLITKCICLTNFIPIKLDILNLHKIKHLMTKKFLNIISNNKWKMQL